MPRFSPDDDFIGVTANTPTNGRALYDPDMVLLGGMMVYPESQAVLEEELERAELMGYDLDNAELMGAWLKKVAKRIAKRIKARIRARKGKPLTVSTPKGQVTIGPGGVRYTTATPDTAAYPVARSAAIPGGGMLDMVKRNPLLLAIPAGLLVLVLLRRRR